MKTQALIFWAHLKLLRVRPGSWISTLGCRDGCSSSEAETREMSYLPTGGGHWWASAWPQSWGKRSSGSYWSFHKIPTPSQWHHQSWWCMASHGSTEGSARGSSGPQRYIFCWPDLMSREFWHLLGAWMWGTVEASLALMLEVPALLLFCSSAWAPTTKGSLNHAKSGALEWGARIWTFFGISLDLLENSGKIRWILQFCTLTNLCTAGFENRDLNSRNPVSSRIDRKRKDSWPGRETLPISWPVC